MSQNMSLETEAALKDALGELSRVLASCDDSKLIHDFLSSLLTPKEALDVAARWELVNRIAHGHTQRHVAQELGISLCKITRGSRELKKVDSPFKKMLLIRDNLRKNDV